MEVNRIALLLAIGIIGTSIALVLVSSSRRNTEVWQPTGPKEMHKISPIALVEEAYGWYAASKQETDLMEALIRTNYGVACLRAIQSTAKLEEVKGATLPVHVQGPVGLMAKLSAQQHLLLNTIRRHADQISSSTLTTVQPVDEGPAPVQAVDMGGWHPRSTSVRVVHTDDHPPRYIPKNSRPARAS